MLEVFSLVNYWAVLVSAIIYWILGSVWFSTIFGNIWSHLVQSHGIKIKKPKTKKMVMLMVGTFILNFLVALGVAFFVKALVITTFSEAITLGLILAILISLATMSISYLWEGRPWKLTLIDLGYPFFGIIISSLILTFWT